MVFYERYVYKTVQLVS